MQDPLRDSLRRLAARAPAPAESGRTTFRLPPRAADALAWLTAQLRSTQKDVLAGLPDVVDDVKETELWDHLGAVVEPRPSQAAPAAAPSFAAPPLSTSGAPDALLYRALVADEPPADAGGRSTYVVPRDALDRLTAQAETLGLPRDEVVARALVALRAAVELRQAGRPEVLRSLHDRLPALEQGVGEAAEKAVALPPHDPIRVHLERAYSHLVEARAALDGERGPR